ncbi:hypothetical protein MHBO_004124, partial [Bonamia ostreae]
KKLPVLFKGIRLSSEKSKSVTRQGCLILEKRSFVSSGPFRYVVIDELIDQTLAINFGHLRCLGLFLVHALETFFKGVSKPLVVAALNKDKGTYSIVGYPSKTLGDFQKNVFGNAFREAAESTESRYRQESFETNFLEIQKEDNSKFFEHLHSGLIDI